MAHKQPPGAVLILPDVGEAAPDCLARNKPRTGRIAERPHRLESHDEDEWAVDADELDLALEYCKIDHPRSHEGVQYRVFSRDDLVVRRIDAQMI